MAPVVAWQVCAHGPLGPRPVVQAASSPWQVCETQDGHLGPKHLEILLWEYYGFSLFGIFMFCFEKLVLAGRTSLTCWNSCVNSTVIVCGLFSFCERFVANLERCEEDISLTLLRSPPGAKL